MAGMVRLHPEDVRAIVEGLAVALGAGSSATGERWLATEEVAREFGRSADWVREHAAELGGRKIGGPRAPWSFPASCLRPIPTSPASRDAPPVKKAPRRRTRRSAVALLPIKERT